MLKKTPFYISLYYFILVVGISTIILQPCANQTSCIAYIFTNIATMPAKFLIMIPEALYFFGDTYNTSYQHTVLAPLVFTIIAALLNALLLYLILKVFSSKPYKKT